jgi:hypothetical protein
MNSFPTGQSSMATIVVVAMPKAITVSHSRHVHIEGLRKVGSSKIRGQRMVCTRCGIIGADARPNWQEQPPRETLTGVQWQ